MARRGRRGGRARRSGRRGGCRGRHGGRAGRGGGRAGRMATRGDAHVGTRSSREGRGPGTASSLSDRGAPIRQRRGRRSRGEHGGRYAVTGGGAAARGDQGQGQRGQAPLQEEGGSAPGDPVRPETRAIARGERAMAETKAGDQTGAPNVPVGAAVSHAAEELKRAAERLLAREEEQVEGRLRTAAGQVKQVEQRATE